MCAPAVSRGRGCCPCETAPAASRPCWWSGRRRRSDSRHKWESRLIHSQIASQVLHPILHHHRAIVLAKAKRNLKWQRDPEGMRLRILEAAKQEFATHGLAGARVDRIAANAGATKPMLYYHGGKKCALYLPVLECAYEKIKVEERG